MVLNLVSLNATTICITALLPYTGPSTGPLTPADLRLFEVAELAC